MTDQPPSDALRPSSTAIKAGQWGTAVYVPSAVRKRLGLQNGDRVTWTISKSGDSACFSIERGEMG